MELKALLTAEYASQMPDGKLLIAGTVNTIGLTRRPGVSPQDVTNVPLGSLYVAVVLEWSLMEGTRHHAELRVVHEDGLEPITPLDLGELPFVMNPDGRPMRSQLIINLQGFRLPGIGDYELQFWVDGRPLGTAALYVIDRTNAA